MQIAEQRNGAITVLSPQGPISGTDAEAFKRAAMDAIARAQGRCVIDAAGVPFVDSKGLEALLDVTEHFSQSGGALKLCAAPETVREVMNLTGLTSSFEYFQDVNTAVRSFL